MPCYYPLDGWRAKNPNDQGRYPVVFKPSQANLDQPLKLPCGNCIGCRLERARQWAMRCVHEATLHDENCFITLTYDDDHLPANNSLDKREWQLFLKKFRERLAPKKIRFFMCGEYGEKLSRPHYHAIIFGWDATDKEDWTMKNDRPIYRSPFLEEVWGNGICTVDEMNFDTANYTARYCMKKVNGEMAEDHYLRVHPITGECWQVEPEFSLQSRRPGIGKAWYDKYKNDLDKGYITMNGVKVGIPKAYEKYMADDWEKEGKIADQKISRAQHIDPADIENGPGRLRVKEEVRLRRIKKLSNRGLDTNDH